MKVLEKGGQLVQGEDTKTEKKYSRLPTIDQQS